MQESQRPREGSALAGQRDWPTGGQRGHAQVPVEPPWPYLQCGEKAASLAGLVRVRVDTGGSGSPGFSGAVARPSY